jgi:peroxiredoxin (alkyl hydroperoxide reductase subunit C)
MTSVLQGGLGTKINHPLLDDSNKIIAKAYDVLLEDAGKAVRAVAIIDKQGIVRCELKNDLVRFFTNFLCILFSP